MPNRHHGVRPRPRLLRIVRARPRLFSSIALGLLVSAGLVVLPEMRPVTRFLVGWDLGVGVYLVLAAHMMARSKIHHIRRRAVQEDEGQAAILVLTVAAGLASLVAIFAHLGSGAAGAGGRSAGHLLFVALTLVLSWVFIHTMFALHYAHDYYDQTPGGLHFPGDEQEPDYWDFVYFSFVLGMTSQVTDVSVTSRTMRRTVLAHALVAFAFNVALLSLTINLAATVI